ncbi:hypothetical protein OO009_09375 [Flavobacteriaceae bacterium KMM 6897]|nr:hypothetical protein [Flavobacteriaceae bacterium KMM 6897]MEB8344517.1 hypothetical protein [Flavobacteriaceae bacterium KMM 6898]
MENKIERNPRFQAFVEQHTLQGSPSVNEVIREQDGGFLPPRCKNKKDKQAITCIGVA